MIALLRRYWAFFFSAALVMVVLFILPLSARSQAYAQTVQTPTPVAVSRTISVTGSGSADAQPDRAVIDVGVTTDAQTAAQALSANSKQMQAVIDALTKANVAAADVRTQTVQLQPRYAEPTPVPQGQPQQAPSDQSNRVIGYTAVNTVEVRIRALNNLGAILDQVVAAGGNQIQDIRFEVSDPTTSMDQAREAAMKDALHKANQLATLASAKLGPVVTINESSQSPVPFQGAVAQMNTAKSAVPISPGSQTVNVVVQVTWELQP